MYLLTLIICWYFDSNRVNFSIISECIYQYVDYIGKHCQYSNAIIAFASYGLLIIQLLYINLLIHCTTSIALEAKYAQIHFHIVLFTKLTYWCTLLKHVIIKINNVYANKKMKLRFNWSIFLLNSCKIYWFVYSKYIFLI